MDSRGTRGGTALPEVLIAKPWQSRKLGGIAPTPKAGLGRVRCHAGDGKAGVRPFQESRHVESIGYTCPTAGPRPFKENPILVTYTPSQLLVRGGPMGALKLRRRVFP